MRVRKFNKLTTIQKERVLFANLALALEQVPETNEVEWKTDIFTMAAQFGKSTYNLTADDFNLIKNKTIISLVKSINYTRKSPIKKRKIQLSNSALLNPELYNTKGQLIKRRNRKK